ncbi:MAG: hypothetical protein H7841_14830, partial [Magnetospirillum sp. WYHS-4]
TGRSGALGLFRLLERASRAEPRPAEAGLAEALARLRHLARPGSLVLLASDFSDLDEAAEQNLAALTERHDLAVLFVWDPLEADLPPSGRYVFGDGESLLAVDTGSPGLRDAFRTDFARRRERAEVLCRRLHIRFAPLGTQQPVGEALRDGLFRLAAAVRGRVRHD